MRINKLQINKTKQIFINPLKEKVSSVIRRTLDITESSARSKQKDTVKQKDIPVWAQNILVSKVSPKNIFIKVLQGILGKPQITKADEDLFRRSFDYALSDIKSAKNILGEGFHETVYKIDDEFAAKLPMFNSSLKIWDTNEHLTLSKKEYSDLKTYYGETIAQLGEVKILRNLGKHTPAGVSDEAAEMEYYFSKYIPQFAKVPQESFNDIAEDCARLNSRHEKGNYYYSVFDYMNPNNIVLKDDKLFWVDRIRTCSKHPNTTTDLLNMLLCKYDCVTAIPEHSEGFLNHLKEARMLFKKIVVAGASANLPLKVNENSAEKVLQKLMTNLSIKKDYNIVVNSLEKTSEINDKNIRVQATENFIDSLFKETTA